jgi:FkbH-like protein
MELAEVQNAHPSMDCLLFPGDDRGAYEFVEHLRDLFGKSLLSAEDKVRLESIKASRTITEQSRRQGYTPDQFLQEAGGKLTVSFGRDFSDSRTLELINKTNQFNLNGERHTETSWRQYLRATNVFLLTASYEDKFGPLGKIAVMTGRTNDQTFEMDHWVMSCRAFSRRIEHACLLHVFQKLNTSEAVVRFVPTARNGPIQNFFAEILASVPEGKFLLSKRQFLNSCPPVYLRIQELSNE